MHRARVPRIMRPATRGDAVLWPAYEEPCRGLEARTGSFEIAAGFWTGMSLLRAFIAASCQVRFRMPSRLRLRNLRAGLGPDLVRWVPQRNIHLTLKFLGDVSSSSLDMIMRSLTAEAARHEAFDMLVEGSGAFPNPAAPARAVDRTHGAAWPRLAAT